jgi:hypothetical protein
MLTPVLSAISALSNVDDFADSGLRTRHSSRGNGVNRDSNAATWSHTNEGGSSSVENIVLLCLPCHREAPMVGRCSVQPMIDCINRRESYVHWVLRRTREKCNAIRPSLLQEKELLGSSANDARVALLSAALSLRTGLHPDAENFSFATLACLIDEIVKSNNKAGEK